MNHITALASPDATDDATRLRLYEEVINKIARGRETNGSPIGGETARQMARDVLLKSGREWTKRRIG